MRQHRFVLSFLVLLVFCSVMVVHGLNSRQNRHDEIRESFILLQTGGYTNEAKVLYEFLLRDLYRQPDRALIQDWQRTVMLIDPSADLPNNLIWRYHWTVRREMEKRAISSIERARRLAEELK